MNIEKMREEFEAAYVEGLVERCGEGFRSTAVYSLTEKNPDGRYKNYTDFVAWWAWQASRESLVIELPESWETYCGTTEEHVMYADEVKDAIKSAGLKVKP